MTYSVAQVYADGGVMAQVVNLNILLPIEGMENEPPFFHEVICWEKEAVIILGSYMDNESLRVTQPDIVGSCILRVPHSMIEKFYTEEEVGLIMELNDIDRRLLSYAR